MEYVNFGATQLILPTAKFSSMPICIYVYPPIWYAFLCMQPNSAIWSWDGARNFKFTLWSYIFNQISCSLAVHGSNSWRYVDIFVQHSYQGYVYLLHYRMTAYWMYASLHAAVKIPNQALHAAVKVNKFI